MRYFFTPGRDVIVGHGGHCDIRLDRPGLGGVDDASQPVPDLVLRFAGTHWLAVDQSRHGLFVDGTRMSTVDIRDGQTIVIGDPERGPRLTFQVSAADDAGASATDPHGVKVPVPQESSVDEEPATGLIPVQRVAADVSPEPQTARIPALHPTADEPATSRFAAVAPEAPDAGEGHASLALNDGHAGAPLGGGAAAADEPATGRIPVEPSTTRIPAVSPLEFLPGQHSPTERPTKPFRYIADEAPAPPAPVPSPAPPPTPPPAPLPQEAQARGRGLIERMAGATRKLRPTQDESDLAERASQTNRLPLLQSGARTIGVAAYQLGLSVDDQAMLSDVSFTARPGSLIAVAGPAPARILALTGVLAATRPATTGILTVDGHDVHAEFEATRSRIGVVPRDNRVHTNLTVQRALEYTAELRLPSNTTVESRSRILDQVLDELELTPHRGTKVGKLPPELRRCVSLAIELLTRPSMLVIDDPGAGLDAAQENHVVAMLRRQADLGCVVVIGVTSPGSLVHLNMCDQVLLLTPAGQPAFAGPPSHIESTLGTTDWLEIFGRIAADPYGAHHAFLARQQAAVSLTPPSVTHPDRTPPPLRFGQQFRLVARRQLRVLGTNPVEALILLLLPVALGALILLVPGDSGLDRPGPSAQNTHEALEILAALNFAAVLTGTATTIRALFTERRIFRREQQLGLSGSAYLLAKIGVFGVIAAVQAAILTVMVIAGKGGPRHGAALLGSADFELYVSVAATTVVSAIVGLALSSFGKSMSEVLPLAFPVVLASLVFAGGLVSLVGTWVYDQLSWFVPAQWGFAAAAATVDLRRVDKLAGQHLVWAHYSGWWLFDMLMLAALGAVWAGLARYRLRTPTT